MRAATAPLHAAAPRPRARAPSLLWTDVWFLCGIALAGQVIVSEYTLARLGPRFEVEELPPAHLKGKEKPLRIFNVKREKPSAVAKVG